MNCLAALYLQDTDAAFEIIVVDNGSDDFNIEKWKSDHPHVIWFSNKEQKNPYVSRNMGVGLARGFYLAFIDAKCQPHVSWLRMMINSCNDQFPIIAGHYALSYDSNALKDKVYGMLYLNNEKNVRNKYGVTAGNLLVNKEVFVTIGLYNEEINTGNDIEWSLRALNSGYSIAYAPDAIIAYPAQSWNELGIRIKKYARGVAAINKNEKHGIRSFFPLRFSTFHDHITHRGLDGLIWRDKTVLYLMTWIMKLKYAVWVCKYRQSTHPLSHNDSK